MLSDEEKKAIEELQKELRLAKNIDNITTSIRNEYAETIIDLIGNQQKEIEELKEQCKEVVCVPEGTCFMLKPKDVDKKLEDKIKARIKELEEYLYRGSIKDDFLMIRIKAKIQELQSLIEKE